MTDCSFCGAHNKNCDCGDEIAQYQQEQIHREWVRANFKACWFCEGVGRVNKSDIMTGSCPECDGRGVIEMTYNITTEVRTYNSVEGRSYLEARAQFQIVRENWSDYSAVQSVHCWNSQNGRWDEIKVLSW